MSEYQHYEFQAIDRPLTEQEQGTLRQYSSRATITSSRFQVDYSWGSFKGNADEWMERYFDAFLYLANWGTRELMLRVPRRVLPLESARPYCAGHFASARATPDFVVLSFCFEEEHGGEWVEEERDRLAALLPVRAELAVGDLRALYLAWLGCAQLGEFDDEDAEPPCPPGLGSLSAALESLADFLRIDRNLIEAAAIASPELPAIDDDAARRWISALPEAEKTEFLLRLVNGAGAHLRAELLRGLHESRASAEPVAGTRARTVGELLRSAQRRAEAGRRQEAERAAREKAGLEQAAAAARERHLTALARREGEAWRELDSLVASKQPRKYDEAVALLIDLRDVCALAGRQAEAAARTARLREVHAKKPGLIERLRKAGLAT